MANSRDYRVPTIDDDPNVPVWLDYLANDVAEDMDGVSMEVSTLASDVTELETNGNRPAATDGFRIRDGAGQVAFQVDGAGTTHIHQIALANVTLGGTTTVAGLPLAPMPAADPAVFRIRDTAGQVALEVTASGNIRGGAGSGGTAVTAVHIIIGGGQSNMSGRGTPWAAEYDPIDSRIMQYGSKNNTAGIITPATVPLDMHDAASGLSPLTIFAREYLRSQPPGVLVLLVPAAHGGTGFWTSSETPLPAGYIAPNPGGGTWTFDRVEPVNLYQAMLAQAQAAKVKAQADYGVVPTFAAFLWHQGEHDSGHTAADYATRFDALVGNLRSQLATPALPVILGGMVPDNTNIYNPIYQAHVQTPARLERCAFVEGQANTGRHNDLVHYGRAGVELLGKAMAGAHTRALSNVAASLPMPPQRVAATRAGTTLSIEWDAPLCRATDYLVEYQVDGGTWTAAPARPAALYTRQAITGVSGTTVLVRVSAVTPAGTSRTSTPITAIGA